MWRCNHCWVPTSNLDQGRTPARLGVINAQQNTPCDLTCARVAADATGPSAPAGMTENENFVEEVKAKFTNPAEDRIAVVSPPGSCCR